MTDRADLVDRFAKLRRAAIWALLGAASGAVAWGIVWAVDGWDVFRIFSGEAIAFYTAPGLIFGLVVGLALHRLGHVRVWQIVLFSAFSGVAWYAGFIFTITQGLEWLEWAVAPIWSNKSVLIFSLGLMGGFVWGAIQTVPVFVIPVTRRPRALITLVAAGAITAGLLLVATFNTVEFFGDLMFLILWCGCCAVYAAVLSTALPLENATLPEAGV